MGILEVQNVNKSFGGLKALHNVNLDIEEGKIHAIIGPNGAGKSTLLNCFVGKLTPDTGTVMFDGHSLLGIKPYEINQLGVSRVFQTPEIFSELSVWENTLIPCFAKRDGSFTLNALSRVSDNKDMAEKAEKHKQEGHHVVADFVCPTPAARELFNADYVVWVDTIKEGRFADTNAMFVKPEKYDYHVTTKDAEGWAPKIAKEI